MPTARHRDVEIHWLRAGDRAGPPVLLVMGLSGSHRDWYRLVPHLADCDVVLFDNRGIGRSSAVRGLLTMDDMARDAVAVLDAAGLGAAHVHGTSMGGMIAQHLALAHRSRVRSLVLSATSPGGMLDKPPWRLLAATALRPIIGSRRTWPMVAPMSDTRRRLGELAGLPVSVLHGDLDHLVPLAHGRALADAIPGARFVLLEGSAHILTTDDEHGLARAVRDHLAHATDHERSVA